MEQYGMDHVGPFKRTAQGNRYILAAIDLLSKYVIAKAMPDTTTNNAIKFVHEEIIGHHGFPKKIITDRGTVFTAKHSLKLSKIGVFVTRCRQPRTHNQMARSRGITAISLQH
jgi:transposase InsO family protein